MKVSAILALLCADVMDLRDAASACAGIRGFAASLCGACAAMSSGNLAAQVCDERMLGGRFTASSDSCGAVRAWLC